MPRAAVFGLGMERAVAAVVRGSRPAEQRAVVCRVPCVQLLCGALATAAARLRPQPTAADRLIAVDVWQRVCYRQNL